MAQDRSGAGAVGATVIIPGEMAARVDRLPVRRMAWELALLVQVGWACAASADGISARLYLFIWLPRHVMTSFEFTAAAPLGWIVLITIPGALLPASMVAIFGKRQRRRTLEELAR